MLGEGKVKVKLGLKMEMNELEKTFKNYVDFVWRNLKVQSPKKDKSTSKSIFRLISNRDWEIRQRVEQLAQGKEFSELVKNTQSTFAKFKGMAEMISISHISYFNADLFLGYDYYWKVGVQNFFCKTGFYQKVVDGVNLNTKDLFDLLCAAFQKEETKTIYLAPMKEVGFSSPIMNYGDFQIRKFTEIDLENIFNNETNRIFYPEAFFNNTILVDYWFITVEDREAIGDQIYEYTQYPPKGFVSPKYTSFSKKLENALRSILLYDWKFNVRDDEIPHEMDKFTIPFVLKNQDNLLTFPEKSKLLVELYGPLRLRDYYPGPYLDHDKEETKAFKKVLKKNKRLIDNLGSNSTKLEYLNIAFGYMIKGFFSEGLEELVYNIIALEALLGEKGKEVGETLKRRLSAILGDTENERKNVRNKFGELYDFRCRLLHGSEFKKPVYEDHLREARELIRKTLLWYLHCLNFFKSKPKALPTHTDVLALIDLDKGYLPVIKGFLGSLPKNFPNVHNWSKENIEERKPGKN